MGKNLEQPSFANKKDWVNLDNPLSVHPDSGEVLLTLSDQHIPLDPSTLAKDFSIPDPITTVGWLSGEIYAIGGDLFRFLDQSKIVKPPDEDLGQENDEDYDTRFAAEQEAIKRN